MLFVSYIMQHQSWSFHWCEAALRDCWDFLCCHKHLCQWFHFLDRLFVASMCVNKLMLVCARLRGRCKVCERGRSAPQSVTALWGAERVTVYIWNWESSENRGGVFRERERECSLFLQITLGRLVTVHSECVLSDACHGDTPKPYTPPPPPPPLISSHFALQNDDACSAGTAFTSPAHSHSHAHLTPLWEDDISLSFLLWFLSGTSGTFF